MLDKLLHSSKFWFAVYQLVQAIIAYAVPDFPDTIKSAMYALVAAVIAAWAVDEANAKTGFERGFVPSLRFSRVFEAGLVFSVVLTIAGIVLR